MNEKENLHYELTISFFNESFFMISERIIYTNILFNDDIKPVLCAFCESLKLEFILHMTFFSNRVQIQWLNV